MAHRAPPPGLTAFVDALGGATGDMWLGAVVDAGASLEEIEQAVSTLGIGDVRVSFGRVRRGGRDAVSVRVRPPDQTPRVATISQVRALLRFAAVDDAIREQALAVFDRLAEAETHGQGVPSDEVVFNQVGMLDDLATIVGTCVGLHRLGVGPMFAGPIGVPRGRADSQLARTVDHLLRGHPIREVDADEAVVTPAGAAIIAALAQAVTDPPHLTITSTGVGAAQRDLSGAGLLHLTIGEPTRQAALSGE